jgi:hypothetical protein
MKKYLLAVLLLVGFASQAQFIPQSIGGTPTSVSTVNGAFFAKKGLQIQSFPDTAAANVDANIKLTPGISIWVNNFLYLRSGDASRWVLISGGSSGGPDGVDSVTRRGCDLLIWQAGDSLVFETCKYIDSLALNYDSTYATWWNNGNKLPDSLWLPHTDLYARDGVAIKDTVVNGVKGSVIYGTTGVGTPQNGLIRTGGITSVDTTVTIHSDIVWKINGNEFTVTEDAVYQIKKADDGQYRRDIVYGDDNGLLHLLRGQQGDVAVMPPLPAGTVLVTIIDVYGAQIIGTTPTPASNAWLYTGNPFLLGDNTPKLGTITNNNLRIVTNNVQRAIFDSSGNVTFQMPYLKSFSIYDPWYGPDASYGLLLRPTPSAADSRDLILTGPYQGVSWRLLLRSGYENSILGGNYNTQLNFGANTYPTMRLWVGSNTQTTGNLQLGAGAADLTGGDTSRSLIFMNSIHKTFVKPRMTTVERDQLTGVLSVTVGLSGTGYTVATVTFSGGGALPGQQATGFVNINGTGGLASVSVTYRGVYKWKPTVTLTGDGAGGTLIVNFIPVLEGSSIYNKDTKKDNFWDGEKWVEVATGTISGVIHQGGDSFGATFSIGANDDQDVELRQNGIARLTISKTDKDLLLAPLTSLRLNGGGGIPSERVYFGESSIYNDGGGLMRFDEYVGNYEFFHSNNIRVARLGRYGNALVAPTIIGDGDIDRNAKLEISDTLRGLLPSRMNTEHMIRNSSNIRTGTITPGSGYTNGTHFTLPATGSATGTGAIFHVTVTGGAVSFVEVATTGRDYVVGDVLTATVPGGGSGFAYTLTGTGTAGVVIYNTDSSSLCQYNGSVWQNLYNAGGGGGGGGSYLPLAGGTLTGPLIQSANGDVSAPAISATGTWYSGGTATTTKPYMLIEPTTATISNTWSTIGTGLGINAGFGFQGNVFDFQQNGVSKLLLNPYLGYLLATVNVVTTSAVSSGLGFRSSSVSTPTILGYTSVTSHPLANLSLVDMAAGTMTQTSGNNAGVYIHPTYNQVASTAANTDLRINRTETSIGSGAQYLIDAQVGGVSKFSVDRLGAATAVKLSSLSTTEQLRLQYDATNYAAFTVNSTGLLTILTNPSNATAIPNGLTVGGTTSNLYINSGTGANSTTTAQYLFGGAATVNLRVGIRGTGNATPAANSSYGSFVIGQNAATIAASGTHSIYAQQVIRPLSITAGAGALTNSASLYVEAAATGATNNYAAWVDAGVTRLDEGVIINSTSLDASAQLQVDGTAKGTLLQRMTKAQRDAIATPAQGLLVFVTDGGGYLSWYNAGWQKVTSAADP